MLLVIGGAEKSIEEDAFHHIWSLFSTYGATKVWKAYLDKFLDISLTKQNNNANFLNPKKFLKNYIKFSTLFVELARNITESPEPHAHVNVTKASCSLILIDEVSHESTAKYKSYWKDHAWMSCAWTFLLNSNLAANITFDNIYFSVDPVDCLNGNLEVKHSYLKEKSFLFCGQNSLFNFYPPHISFHIKLFARLYITFRIIASYSVFDKGIISNLLPSSYMMKPDFIFLLRRKAHLWLYSLVVQKSDNMILSITPLLKSTILVHDGPGTLSYPVKQVNEVYTT